MYIYIPWSMRFYPRRSICVLWCCLTLLSCARDEEIAIDATSADLRANNVPADQADPVLTNSLRVLVHGYLQQVEFDFANVETNLTRLQSDIVRFLDSPDTDTMNTMRSGWLNAHVAFELTTLHHYFAGMLLAEQESLTLLQLQYRTNHWPILPGYIDYVDGYPNSGIVSDITVVLDVPSLRQQHGTFDLAEATLGFHVLEFLIWGENPDGNTLRPASDYESISQLTALQADGGLKLVQLGKNRRRQLLSLTAQVLMEDFQSTQSLWQESSSLFREKVNLMDSPELLILLMTAMTSMLTEELLVRSLYPLLNGDYTDSIQSPYSHSTQNAVAAQLSSVEGLLLESKSGTGTPLDALLVTISTDFEEFFYQNFDSSKECLALLYPNLKLPENPRATLQAEFEIVECINLLTNTINHLEQIKIGVSNPSNPV